MLFLRYLWTHLICRVTLAATFVGLHSSLIWINLETLEQESYLILTVPILMVVTGGVTFCIIYVCVAWYSDLQDKMEYIWMPDYKRWKENYRPGPSEIELEHEKITKILDRYCLEQKVKKQNASVAEFYKEYQILLALSDGIELDDGIELSDSWSKCLKSKRDL